MIYGSREQPAPTVEITLRLHPILDIIGQSREEIISGACLHRVNAHRTCLHAAFHHAVRHNETDGLRWIGLRRQHYLEKSISYRDTCSLIGHYGIAALPFRKYRAAHNHYG